MRISDPTGTIVTPLEPVTPAGDPPRAGEAEDAGHRARGPSSCSSGSRWRLDGSDTDQTRETRAFAERLAGRLGEEVPVQLHDERFTTRMAQRLSGDSRAAEDSRAAAHLLEDWLASGPR